MDFFKEAAEDFKNDKYISISRCSQKYHIDRKTFTKYLKENNIYYDKRKANLNEAIQEILSTPESKRRIDHCAKKHHVNYKKLADALHEIGVSTENQIEKEAKEKTQKAIEYYKSHQNDSMAFCAELFNISRVTLSCALQKQNVPFHEKYSSTPQTEEKIMNAVEEYKKSKTITITECAEKYSIERHRLRDALKKLGIKTHEDVIAKDRNGNNFVMKTKNAGKRICMRVSLDENFFEKIDTEEKAYWLGFLLADGSVSKNSNRISIGLAIRDYDHLHRFKKSLNLTANIAECFSRVKALDNYYPTCSIRFSSEKMKNDLAKCNVTPLKSGHEKAFENLPKDLFRHYLRGFFDGDGSIGEYDRGKNSRCQNKRWFVSLVSSFELMQYFSDELNKRNISISKPQKCSNSFVYEIRTSNSLEIIKLMKFIYRGANIYLPRKYERASKICRLYSTSIEE